MVDWYSALLRYGIDVEHEEEVLLNCPFHEDRRKSCAINIDKGLWICFAGCGQGNLKSFLQKYSGKSWADINAEFEIEELDLDLSFLDEYHEEEPENIYVEPEDQNKVPSSHWIYDRGFLPSLVESWGCRINKFSDFMIPVRNQKKDYVGWIYRRQKAIPKYMFSKGFKKSQVLFGVDKIQDFSKLFIVEGALDCMWLNQNGYPSVAILGASVSKKQLELISSLNPSEVVLSLDNDTAGAKGISKATFDMDGRFLISYLRLPKKYKDVQEIRNKDVLDKVMRNTTIF